MNSVALVTGGAIRVGRAISLGLGVVIVGSILLAFGLQAWWEGRQEQELELERTGLELV